ncbi:MAG TPA: hypothetical protein DHW02_13100 [Ktedonobacter sp.]|nr:hypothetical protein [Ktedonobacter sp.]
MKKLLIVLVVISVLLVGCSSIVGIPDKGTTPTTVSTSGNSTSHETTCHVLQGQLNMLAQEVQQDTTDLAAAHDTLVKGRIQVSLHKLHLRIQQVQKEYKGCSANS